MRGNRRPQRIDRFFRQWPVAGIGPICLGIDLFANRRKCLARRFRRSQKLIQCIRYLRSRNASIIRCRFVDRFGQLPRGFALFGVFGALATQAANTDQTSQNDKRKCIYRRQYRNKIRLNRRLQGDCFTRCHQSQLDGAGGDIGFGLRQFRLVAIGLGLPRFGDFCPDHVGGTHFFDRRHAQSYRLAPYRRIFFAHGVKIRKRQRRYLGHALRFHTNRNRKPLDMGLLRALDVLTYRSIVRNPKQLLLEPCIDERRQYQPLE